MAEATTDPSTINNDITSGPSTDTTSGPSTDTTSGPSTDTTSGPSTDTTSGPSTDTTSGPSTDTTSGPSTDTTSGPSTDTTSGPSTDTISGTAIATDAHIFQDSWSTLPKDVLIDKIKGTIYGQAIGDAIGLATEFLSKEQSFKVYGKLGPSGYSDIVQDFHRSRWDRGDWTDDTDQMLLIMLSIISKNGIIDEKDFASRLHNWMKHGFSELGDFGGMGIGMTVSQVLHHHLFLTDPHAAAREVWERSGRYLAANGAIMRTSILGILNFNDLDKVIANTCAISRVTHADPRCTASCVAVTTAIAMMLQGKYDPLKKDQLKSLVDDSFNYGVKHIEHKDQEKEMRNHIDAKNLKVLKLDDSKTIGYTFKALGSGFYGLRKGQDFHKTIIELIMEGGDADSNGSVCGAMLGCKVGFSGLPVDLLQFVHRQWLDNHVDTFLGTIGLKT